MTQTPQPPNDAESPRNGLPDAGLPGAGLPPDWLSAYLDGELSAAEQPLARAAIAASPELQAELDTLRGVSTLLRTLPPAVPTVDFAERFESDVSGRGGGREVGGDVIDGVARRLPTTRGTRWVAGLGSVAALGILVLVAGRGGGANDGADAVAMQTADEPVAIASVESVADAMQPDTMQPDTVPPDTVPPDAKFDAAPPAAASVAETGRSTKSLSGSKAAPSDVAIAKASAMDGEAFDSARGQSAARSIQSGDVFEQVVIEQMNDDAVAVIRWEVVDVSEAIGQLRVLLVQAGVTSSQPDATVRADRNGRLEAIYLEADQTTVAEVLAQLPPLEEAATEQGYASALPVASRSMAAAPPLESDLEVASEALPEALPKTLAEWGDDLQHTEAVRAAASRSRAAEPDKPRSPMLLFTPRFRRAADGTPEDGAVEAGNFAQLSVPSDAVPPRERRAGSPAAISPRQRVLIVLQKRGDKDTGGDPDGVDAADAASD